VSGGTHPTDVAAVQRRTVRVLVAAQAVGAMAITIGVATAALLARDLTGSERWAGLVQTGQVLGAAAAAYALARVMGTRGRRVGLAAGYLVGGAGALLAVVAAAVGSVALLLAGALLLGATTATNAASRFAAADLAEDHHRARALSVVVWATTIGAVAGPNLTGPATALAAPLGIPELAAPFALGGVATVVAALVVASLLRPDPLLLARELGGHVEAAREGTAWGRVVGVVRQRPVVGAAIAGMSLAHAVMISVMVMTPLHMDAGGAGLEVIGVVISVHVLGMYALSPVVGWAADRWGRGRVLGLGGVVLLVSLVLAGLSPAGSSWQIFAGLFLLGLGWACATVAGSALVADHAPLAARTDVQGAADVLMGLTAAAAGGLSGLVVAAWGYDTLALTTGVLGAGVLVAAWFTGARPGVSDDRADALAGPPGHHR
jgi:MFS family permease